MLACRSFKHCLAISVGLLIGGGSLSSLAGTATSCQQVLLENSTNIQQAQMDQTIEALAAMKLKLDKSLSQGNLKNSTAMKVLAQDFEVKRTELLRRADGLLTKNQLRSKMLQRIRELQKLEQQKDQRESETREIETVSTFGPFKKPFKLVDNLSNIKLPLNYGPAIPPAYSFVFLQEQNAVILLNRHLGPSRFDLETGKVTKLLEYDHEGAFQISKDQKTLYALTGKGILNTYNLQDMTLKDSVQLGKIKTSTRAPYRDFEFSPSGDEVLIGTTIREGRFSGLRIYQLFDLHTGKKLPWQGVRGAVDSKDGSAGFISSSEILFSSKPQGKMLIYNFQTGSHRLEGEKANEAPLQSVVVSKDHQQISYLQGDRLFTRILGQDKQIANKGQETAEVRHPSLKFLLSGAKTDYLSLVWHDSIEVLDQSNLNTVFNFEYRYSQMSLQNDQRYIMTLGAVFGLDQKSILVAYNKVKDNGDPEIYFDVWKSE
jgi:hypothetical protein